MAHMSCSSYVSTVIKKWVRGKGEGTQRKMWEWRGREGDEGAKWKGADVGF